jgi:hypothetical protein
MSSSAALSLTTAPVIQKLSDVKSAGEAITEAIGGVRPEALSAGNKSLDKALSFKTLLDGLGQGGLAKTQIAAAGDQKELSNSSDGNLLMATQSLPEFAPEFAPEFNAEFNAEFLSKNPASNPDIGLVIRPKPDILTQAPLLNSALRNPLLAKLTDQVSPVIKTLSQVVAKPDADLQVLAPPISEVSREIKSVAKPNSIAKLNVPNLLEGKISALSTKDEVSEGTKAASFVSVDALQISNSIYSDLPQALILSATKPEIAQSALDLAPRTVVKAKLARPLDLPSAENQAFETANPDEPQKAIAIQVSPTKTDVIAQTIITSKPAQTPPQVPLQALNLKKPLESRSPESSSPEFRSPEFRSPESSSQDARSWVQSDAATQASPTFNQTQNGATVTPWRAAQTVPQILADKSQSEQAIGSEPMIQGGAANLQTSPQPTLPLGVPELIPAKTASPAFMPHAYRPDDNLMNLALMMQKRVAEKSTKFAFELHPADLGRVNVSLNIGKDGSLTAHLRFDTPASESQFKAQADELRRQLEQQGFNLKEGDLSFSSRQDQGARRQNQDSKKALHEAMIKLDAVNNDEGAKAQGLSAFNKAQQSQLALDTALDAALARQAAVGNYHLSLNLMV